ALGPNDVYVPRYYNTGWQPYYLTNDNLYQRVANLDVPGAVMVVPVDEFTRGFDWRRARRADRNQLASVNPVLDPLLYTPLRNAVVNSAWGRGKKDIPPGIAKKLDDTVVVTSVDPVAPRFRPDLRRSMRVETVSDRGKGQKFKVKDERGNGRSVQRASEPSAPSASAPVEAPRVNRGQEKKQAAPERPQAAPRQQTVQQQPQRVNRGQEKRQAAQAERPVRQPQQQQQPKAERVTQPRATQPKAEKPQGGQGQANPKGGQGQSKGKGKKP
ncbi:MAG TPA: hypothetical protein VFR51_00250, partial [Pyrinomonadaceae bacterium]|nr:hypothetical protein [Pyrinomonadaceae bacterium]